MYFILSNLLRTTRLTVHYVNIVRRYWIQAVIFVHSDEFEFIVLFVLAETKSEFVWKK